MSQFLENRLTVQADPPMLCFFKGILPAISSFDDDETLELQSGVLSMIQKIKKKREYRINSANYGCYSQSRDPIQHPGYTTTHNQNMLSSGGFEYSPQNPNIHPLSGPGPSTQSYQTLEPPSPAPSAWSTSQERSPELNFDDIDNF